MLRRTLKIILIGIGISFLAATGYVILKGPILMCGFDDGPFFGAPVKEIPDYPSIQTLELNNKMILSVYRPIERSVSPVLVLRNKQNEVIWAIHADGFEQGDVSDIQLLKFDLPFFWYGTVRGTVKWSFGTEAAYWYISRFGRLAGYCYSW